MAVKRTRKMLVAMTALFGLAAVAAGPLSAVETDVSLAQVAGSRTLLVSTVTGTNLDGGELDLGTAHTGSFLVNVTDVDYDHVGYQVSSTLSNLYLFDGGFGCGSQVDSADVAVSFPIDAQVQDPGAIVEGVVDLVGTVSGSLTSLLDPLGAIDTILGLAGLDLLSGRDLSTTVDALSGQLEDALAGAFDGLDAVLPVNVSSGTPGPFTDPAAHPTCGGGAGTPTSLLLMSGNASDIGDFVTGLIGDLTGLVNGVTGTDMITAGTLDSAAAEAVAAQAIQDLEDAINAELAALALPPIALPQTPAIIDQVLDDLVGLLGLTDLIGQTGVGVSIPTLTADPSSAPVSGIYKGRMEVTLVDVS